MASGVKGTSGLSYSSPSVVGAALVTIAAYAVTCDAADPTYTRVVTKLNLGALNAPVAAADFNNDGYGDLLIQRNTHPTDDYEKPERLVLLLGKRDGSFRSGMRLLPKRAKGRAPHFGLTGDFNSDGWVDVAIYDRNVIGTPPFLLLGNGSKRMRISHGLARGVARHANDVKIKDSWRIQIKRVSAGDIDSDGDLDLWVESCGNDEFECSHWMMNEGNDRFLTDVTRADDVALHDIVTEENTDSRVDGVFWRQWASIIVDVDGDGHNDMVLGQHGGRTGPNSGASSYVILNDGSNQFRKSNRKLLPFPKYQRGRTTVTSIAALDFNGDDRPDLALVHHVNREGVEWAGRYIQLLENRGKGRFVDRTRSRMPSQAKPMRRVSKIYGGVNGNSESYIRAIDVNRDGQEDLVLEAAGAPIGPEAPLVYLSNRRGHFRELNPKRFTMGERWFGEQAVAVDVNGDRIIDFVTNDNLAGRDGLFQSKDDQTAITTMLARSKRLSAPRRGLPPARVGRHYEGELPFFGGRPPYRVKVVSGRLPGGLRLLNGVLRGAPERAGRFRFKVRVVDSAKQSVQRRYVLRVQGG